MNWSWSVESLFALQCSCNVSGIIGRYLANWHWWGFFCRIVKFCHTKQHITSTILWKTMKRWKAMNQIGLSLEFTDSGCRAAAQYVYRKHSSFNLWWIVNFCFYSSKKASSFGRVSPVAFDLQELRCCTELLLTFSVCFFLCFSCKGRIPNYALFLLIILFMCFDVCL